MAGSIKGIIVEIGGDTSGLQKALKEVNSSTSSLSKELRGVNSLLKLDPKNTELTAQKQEVLKQSIEQTSKKLDELRKAQEMADDTIANGGEISQENYRNLQREIINTENRLKNLKVEASKWTTAGRSIEEFGNKVSNISNKIDKMGTTLTTRLTLPILGVTTLLTKSAMEQETAIQQVEKIYGKASNTIKDFAENTALSYNMSAKEAYKYSQIYGNLIQSITNDEKENAQYTQDLLKASAVIASATGRTMEDVMDRIRSGLLGNTEAIEDLGVNVNVALLESTDAFKKFAGDKSWNQLDFQTQQQIRLFGILEQTTKKYGSEINKNTASEVQKLTAKFNNMTNKLGKNLLPIANKLIDIVEKGIDKLDDLSDEEVENITNIVMLTAAIGPAIKILGTLGKTVGTGTKAVGIFSQAMAVAKNNATSNVTSINNLSKVISALSTPVGFATVAFGALTATLIAVKAAQLQEQASLEGLREEVENQKESWNNLAEARNTSLNNSMTEISICENLKNELMQITDENGNVKAGYEERAKVILNTLNGALETEYGLNGNIIEQYQELKNNIDEVIAKKKAEAVLTAYQEEYGAAIREQAKATETLIKLKQQQEEVAKKLITGTYEERIEARNTVKQLSEEIKTQTDLISSYGKTVQNYENLQKASAEGSKKAITGAISEIGISYETLKETAGKSTIEQINAQQNYVDAIKSSLQEAKNQHNEYQQQILENQLSTNEEQLTNLKNSLVQQTNTIKELTPEQTEAWKEIANRSVVEYSQLLAQVPETTQREIEEATGIVGQDVGFYRAMRK